MGTTGQRCGPPKDRLLWATPSRRSVGNQAEHALRRETLHSWCSLKCGPQTRPTGQQPGCG